MPSVEEIVENFELLDDWSDRYRYLIELGRDLEPLPAVLHDEVHRVKGCASQVWLDTRVDPALAGPMLSFRGDSDAHIVKGLIYLALAIYNGRAAGDILRSDPLPVFARLGLAEHLTPQRSNGFRAMVERIRHDAREALVATTTSERDRAPRADSVVTGQAGAR